ncbi:hypothetical protein INR49_028968 [Caranx melampygus]|nr:hypothetical protein INR49_028968 [Caranx melampygus]
MEKREEGVYHAGNVAVCFEAIQMEMRRINSNQPLLCDWEVQSHYTTSSDKNLILRQAAMA